MPPSIDLQDEYKRKKDELDTFKLRVAEKAMLWSRANWLEHGEKLTRYFLNMHCKPKKSADKDIHVLEDTEGKIITGNKDILNNCKTFFLGS